jgi:hypothetical protein
LLCAARCCWVLFTLSSSAGFLEALCHHVSVGCYHATCFCLNPPCLKCLPLLVLLCLFSLSNDLLFVADSRFLHRRWNTALSPVRDDDSRVKCNSADLAKVVECDVAGQPYHALSIALGCDGPRSPSLLQRSKLRKASYLRTTIVCSYLTAIQLNHCFRLQSIRFMWVPERGSNGSPPHTR